MLNRIIRFSLDNRFTVVTGALLILCIGIWQIPRLQIDVFPDLTAPTVVIMTESSSMSAEDVEQMVTFPIETAINGASGIRRVRSVSQTGFSVVTVEFDWGEDTYLARQIINERLSGIESVLPSGVAEPILAPQTSLMGEVMVIGLTSDGNVSQRDLRTIADWTFRPRLLSLTGVANVAVTGGEIKEYKILLSPSRMTAYSVSTEEVLEACRNLNTDGSGGIIDNWGNEYNIRIMNRSNDPEQIGKNVVKLSENGVPITISNVADVIVGDKTPRIGDASVDAAPAVRLSVTKQPGISTLSLTEDIDRTVEDIKKTLPKGVTVRTDIFRQENFIMASVQNIFRSLIEGGILIIAILFLFLGNVRTAIISIIALPISLIITMLALHSMGMTMNTMSIGGMAIALGSLVDDAIIDVDNVYKRLQQNHHKKKTLDVVYEASSEIRSSIWNATLIIIITFVPIFFLSGMEGRMLRPLGISFIISLFASMIVAITLTPVLGSFLLTSEKEKKETKLSILIKDSYSKALAHILNHPRRVIISVVILLTGALLTFPFLGSSFLPQFNEGSMTVEVAALPGISLEKSIEIGTAAEKALMEIPEVDVVSRKTGRSELDEHALGTNTSEMDVPFTLGSRSRQEVFADARERLSAIPGVAVEVGQPISHRIDMLLSGSQTSIAIKVFGPSLTKLLSIGNQIKENIEDIPGLVDLKVEQQYERPEIHIKPIKELVSYYGIPENELSETIGTAMLGTPVGYVIDEGKKFDIIVRMQENHSKDISDIGSIPLHTQKGDITLSDIAEIVSSAGANSISRENISRKISVTANTSGDNIVGVLDEIKERVKENIKLPDGYHIEYGGQGESARHAKTTLLLTSLLAIILVYILLYKEFKSFKLTSIVLANMPLALIGAIYTVAFTDAVVSIPSVIGFISLLGIATRNGILLVSHYESLGEMPLKERILTGTVDRIIPILMTALSSALALIPLAINGDKPGNEIQSPMAAVILGGLFTSTLLNLILIPTIYSLANKKK